VKDVFSYKENRMPEMLKNKKKVMERAWNIWQ
jgi:hypothetical protein